MFRGNQLIRLHLLQHMGVRAFEIINALYRRLIPAQAEVMDLMAGFDSHLQGIAVIKLHTFSSRGWPRSSDDPHADKTPYSDPVYAVWGCKPEQ